MIKEPKSYSKDNAAIRCLVNDSKLRIFFLEELSRNHLYMMYFKLSDYLFVQNGWHYTQPRYKYEMEYISQFNNIDISKIFILANTDKEKLDAQSVGFNSLYINHNCWIDENLFTLSNIPTAERAYDMVINTRPETWKRPFLASKISRLAVIKGHNFRLNDYFDLNSLNPMYINDKRISLGEVSEILSNSYCGGIFSEEEGACYSSSEYLLSGLPVVSTPSRGGRDVWYQNDNSIIVNPTEGDVKEGMEILKSKLLSNVIHPHKIRLNHIEQSNKFRKDFEIKLREILGELQDKFLPTYGLGKIFQHKMVTYVKPQHLNTVF